MAGVLPKVKTYFFLSMICLFINFSVLFVSLIATADTNMNTFTGEAIYKNESMLIEDDSAELKDFVFAGGTSFVPFFSLVPIAFPRDEIRDKIPNEMTLITGIIISIIGAFQIFLLSIIILNMIPKLVGSGFDV